ncbi:MAG TPA: cupin domain-containing protein [Hyphomicrobiaceae bacterium]|nr:cupin domain-containing protein [Hyphomicrobiaceae bacterium]
MQRAMVAKSAAARTRPSNYPPPFAERMLGRTKRPLGDLFGLRHFGVNLTTLAPGAMSALFHRHSRQDEFIFILEGDLVLVTDSGEQQLQPGMCFGFPAAGTGHHLVNRSDREATYLEVGDRSAGDEVTYPNDDLAAALGPDRQWIFTHKDGTPY